jgi:hypothetical protein
MTRCRRLVAVPAALFALALTAAAVRAQTPPPSQTPPADPPAVVVPPTSPPAAQEPATAAAPAQAAEKPVPRDSVRLTVVGCVRGRALVSVKAAEADATSGIPPGIRFNLTGPRDLMRDVRAYDRQLVQVTGLVLRGALQQQGVGLALDSRGRVVLGPPPVGRSPMTGDPRSGTGAMSATMDVSGVRKMDGSCSRE